MTLLTLEPARTSLVVIDLTRGVLSIPTVPHLSEEVFANTVRLADAFGSAGGFVVLVNVNSVDGNDFNPQAPRQAVQAAASQSPDRIQDRMLSGD